MPRDPTIRPIGETRDQLGEGPVWDDRSERLLHVDILRGKCYTWRPADNQTLAFDVGGEVSAVIPRSGDGVVWAVGHELIAIDGRGARETLAIVEDELSDNRFNDCRCDPQGRLWAGTMSKTRTPGTSALYRLVAGEPIERMIASTTLSNGIGWSPGGDVMYFVDSTTQHVDAFDFDCATGSINNRRHLAHIDPADGLPDGIAVDAEGGIWLCLFGGAALRRYSERGDSKR